MRPSPAATPPHRPLFFLAGLWALVAPSVWIWPGPLAALVAEPLFWHLHEFFFGMAAAAVGGYLLTALPHWAGGGIGPVALCLLVLAWVAGRGAMLWPDPPPPVFLALATSYPLILGLLLARPLVRARAWARLWMAALPLALAGAEAAILGAHLRQDLPDWAPLALTLGFSLVIGLIGGKIVPAFARSRLRHIAPDLPLGERRAAGWLAALATAAGLILLPLEGASTLAGLALIAAGVLQALRLGGWRMRHLIVEPDILMMQLAFGWLALGLILVGAALVWPAVVPVKDALHALTMGAMGGMMLAIAARPLLPRAGGRLHTTPDIGAAFALICLATALRLAGPGAGIPPGWPALIWSCAWGLFLRRSWAARGTPAPFPALSAEQGKGAPPDEIPRIGHGG